MPANTGELRDVDGATADWLLTVGPRASADCSKLPPCPELRKQAEALALYLSAVIYEPIEIVQRTIHGGRNLVRMPRVAVLDELGNEAVRRATARIGRCLMAIAEVVFFSHAFENEDDAVAESGRLRHHPVNA